MLGGDRPQQERTHLRTMKGYIPGAQPGPEAIKLNTNENPFPPSPRVMAALAKVEPRMLQRYPDPMANGFRDVAARIHGLDRDQVIATNGGDELLRLALTTFVDSGRAVGITTPSYGVYCVLSEVHQAPLSDAPLTDSWDIAADTAARWNADGAQLAFITNPHAPSGALFRIEAIERLADAFHGVLLIDEAYIDFVDPCLKHDPRELIAQHSNVLLLRTLSKGYSLAGLRIAYGLGAASLIRPILEKTKDSYNVDAIAQALGAVALNDGAHAKATWEHVRRERDRVSRDMQALGFSAEPSQTNFILVSPPESGSWGQASKLLKDLRDRGIYLRWFDEPRLRHQLRVSIGTAEENDALIQVLRETWASTATTRK